MGQVVVTLLLFSVNFPVRASIPSSSCFRMGASCPDLMVEDKFRSSCIRAVTCREHSSQQVACSY